MTLRRFVDFVYRWISGLIHNARFANSSILPEQDCVVYLVTDFSEGYLHRRSVRLFWEVFPTLTSNAPRNFPSPTQ